jgi:hypothetical protein
LLAGGVGIGIVILLGSGLDFEGFGILGKGELFELFLEGVNFFIFFGENGLVMGDHG